MNLEAYEAFIFDLDGTLIDSGKYHSQAFADAVLAMSGYELTDEEKHEFFASHSTRFTPILNERHGLGMVPQTVLQYKRRRVKEIFQADLFEGAREFLDYWYHRKPMALATNSPLSFVAPALREVDLFKYFDCVTTADEVVQRKPDPEIVELTLLKLQSDPRRTLVFEDQNIGIESAQRAGADVIVLDNGQPLSGYPADVEVFKWSRLLEFSETE